MPPRPAASGDRINRFERARIIGARSLQISSGAPILVPVEPEEALDPILVAQKEFNEDKIPITVLRHTSAASQES